MATPTLDQILAEIDQWFTDTIHGSIIAREVDAYNHVYAAYNDLKSRITALLEDKPAPAPQPAAGAPKADSKAKPTA